MLPNTLITLVQTDKAKYKTGQKVLFRVVTLKNDLTAEEGMVSAGEGVCGIEGEYTGRNTDSSVCRRTKCDSLPL